MPLPLNRTYRRGEMLRSVVVMVILLAAAIFVFRKAVKVVVDKAIQNSNESVGEFNKEPAPLSRFQGLNLTTVPVVPLSPTFAPGRFGSNSAAH